MSAAFATPPDRALTEGEAWTRRELERLLARRFSPPAIVRFLVSSERRAAEIRTARPAQAARAWGWLALGAGAWALPAAAGVAPFRGRVRSGLGWWMACAAMLDWHLGMVETEDGRPRQLGAADALTLARAWLVPVAWESPTALVCLTAAITDVLDGRLARRAEPTRIGRDLEGLVDACFAGAALRGARRRETIASLAVAAELSRLTVGFAYALFVYFGRATAPDPALVRAARATTPMRIGGLIAAGAGRRRAASALVGAGALVSVAVDAQAALSSRRRRRRRA